MTFEKVFYDETAEDWDGTEIYASEIEDAMDAYRFCGITAQPLSFKFLQSMFSHKMFA
jgi:hypothetical protein